MRSGVKELWKLCFDDTDAYVDLYFSERYEEERNLSLCLDGKCVAALQLIPYPMTYGGSLIPSDYVSGVCTHPDYRNRGLMQCLMKQALERMYENGTPFSTLIPAEEWLYGYYGRFGYVSLFRQEKRLYLPAPPPFVSEGAELRTDCPPETAYSFLNRRWQEHPCCTQHTEADFRIVLADLRLSGGFLYTLLYKGNPVAAALAYPDGEGGLLLGECQADSPHYQELLLWKIYGQERPASLNYITPPSSAHAGEPLGMARIVRAEAMLERYAAARPSLTMRIGVTDEQLPQNDGCYLLHGGTCKKTAGQPEEGCPALTIAQLTELLFAEEQPYMSLMLN